MKKTLLDHYPIKRFLERVMHAFFEITYALEWIESRDQIFNGKQKFIIGTYFHIYLAKSQKHREQKNFAQLSGYLQPVSIAVDKY